MTIRAAILNEENKVINVVLLNDINEISGAIASETANIGDTWDGVNFIPNIAPLPPAAPPVWEWYIDVGPFFDRFGAYKIPVLASTDVNVIAMVKDIQVRKWVDLKRPDVQQSLVYIGTKVGGFIAQEQNKVLNTPVTDEENWALRKLYFS